MGMFDKLIANLKSSKKTIVFTEGTDSRILSAADRLLKEGLMGVVLCGNVDDVKAAAAAGGTKAPAGPAAGRSCRCPRGGGSR